MERAGEGWGRGEVGSEGVMNVVRGGEECCGVAFGNGDVHWWRGLVGRRVEVNGEKSVALSKREVRG